MSVVHVKNDVKSYGVRGATGNKAGPTEEGEGQRERRGTKGGRTRGIVWVLGPRDSPAHTQAQVGHLP